MLKLKVILLLIFISPIAIICPVKGGKGLMLLYRPIDVSSLCALSEHLRYDVSYGMGMSDTITLVFRNLMEIDYECIVEIATETIQHVYLLIVIRFPTTLGFNCYYNPNCFTVLKKTSCINLCEEIAGRNIFSHYFMVSVTGRLRFRFVSNSSINADINAHQYEVTATAARRINDSQCDRINETMCVLRREKYCFTSGAVCDGIKNCGIPDWFDERKSMCDWGKGERLGYMPVVAVGAALICATLALCHFLIKCLPPNAYSFFIFNANEDNRLCIKPLFRAPRMDGLEIETARRTSLIPGSSSTSGSNVGEDTLDNLERSVGDRGSELADMSRKKTSVKSVTARIHERLKSVTGRTKSPLFSPSQQRATSVADVRDVRLTY